MPAVVPADVPGLPGSPALPAPRRPSGPYRVCLVCLGNICRSPMAEVMLRAELDRAGLAGLVEVDSAGTGDWHLGEPMAGQAARGAGPARLRRVRAPGPADPAVLVRPA